MLDGFFVFFETHASNQAAAAVTRRRRFPVSPAEGCTCLNSPEQAAVLIVIVRGRTSTAWTYPGYVRMLTLDSTLEGSYSGALVLCNVDHEQFNRYFR